ncbi:thioredoxin reductase glit [Camillea tinctor]|nr:thioredoxin reductase glit [Camillea tinctor]
MSAPTNALVDVLILGGGPAGLACATALSRQLHTCLVLSSAAGPEAEEESEATEYRAPHFRNARAKHMHNVLGWDHADPAALRARARADLAARYGDTAEVRDGVEVVKVEKLEDGEKKRTRFRAVDAKGRVYEGRKLVVASGIQDVMPDIPGYAELWGRRIFHCLFCHGFETRGSPSAAVLATGTLTNPQFATGVSRMAARLTTRSVTVYTNGDLELAAQLRQSLRSTARFRIDARKIASLSPGPARPQSDDAKKEKEDDEGPVRVTLADGSAAEEAFLVHVPDAALNGPVVADLGLEMAAGGGHIEAQAPFGSTSVRGVYAAGDCATGLRAVAIAAMMGSTAAAGVAHELQGEDDAEDE